MRKESAVSRRRGSPPMLEETPPSVEATPPPAPHELDLETLKGAYLQHKKLRNFSPLTLSQKDQHLSLFIDFLHQRGIISIHFVTSDTIEQFKAYLAAHRTRKGTPLCANTIRERIFNIQDWFLFLKRRAS